MGKKIIGNYIYLFIWNKKCTLFGSPQCKQEGIHTSTAHVVQTLNFNNKVRQKCLLQKNGNNQIGQSTVTREKETIKLQSATKTSEVCSVITAQLYCIHESGKYYTTQHRWYVVQYNSKEMHIMKLYVKLLIAPPTL